MAGQIDGTAVPPIPTPGRALPFFARWPSLGPEHPPGNQRIQHAGFRCSAGVLPTEEVPGP